MNRNELMKTIAFTLVLSGTLHAVPHRRPVLGHPRVVAPRIATRCVVARPPALARRILVAGVTYWVHAGVYYKSDGGGYVVVPPPVIRTLPPRHRVVVVRDKTYYLADDIYYEKVSSGYVVVEKPHETLTTSDGADQPAAVAPTQSDTVTIYAPKRDADGFVPVLLKEHLSGWLGPQGEYYPSMPPVAQLTEMYGLSPGLRIEHTNTFFIHVPNPDGESFTRVILTRHDNGFVGPQGEFYPIMPTVSHLAAIYTSPSATEAEGEPGS